MSDRISESPSTNYELQNIEPIKQKLDEVKQITVDNIDRVLERGEKIDLLVDSSQRLQTNSVLFYKSSNKLKRKMYNKKIRCYVLFLVFSGLGIYIMAATICGNADVRHCK